ncbi:MAG: LURP-one-related family protein [Clostridia bacterium]|nr:LURP-one-related family protein [Clostridia bacterium]
MVRLYIRQKVFSIGDKYNILNEQGQPVFSVSSEIFTFGAKIHLYDVTGLELFFIQQKLFRFLPEYHIYSGDNVSAIVKKEFSFLRPRLNIDSQFGNFTFEGNLFGMDFVIMNNGNVVGELHKKWLSFGDTYELTVYDDDNAPFFCALAIAIDNCLHNENDHH